MRNEFEAETPSGAMSRSNFAGGAFTVVASDMDGTILDHNDRLTERTKDTLYELSACGVHVIFATGRNHLTVDSTRRELLQHYKKRHAVSGACSSLSLGCDGIYVVSSDGARVQNPKGELIYSKNLDSDIVRVLYDRFALRDHGDDPQRAVSVMVHQTGKFSLYRPFMSDEQLVAKYGVLPELHSSLSGSLPTDAVAKLTFRCIDPETLRCYEKEINELFRGRAAAVMASNTCLGVLSAGVSKAAAIRQLGEILNFDPARDVIAFGDSMNDMEMLVAAAKGCVMGNAQQRLKDALPTMEVVGANSEDGVARKLEEVFSLPARLPPHGR
ncbi:haloacid dehalogenase hydrolase [Trypanosoma conorhini]|uniref:Haloacid dehalogenase hydrolase n=1 Tax=Trypanosoma conorhini TaxID=83891 RepID=A0A422MZB2_9TRYP|nr:haloacid dehalogenase hydrolase [Trypanosoma conorhini]RNE98568.1 haloacid dehalogenase hydrolase [Trypanosoma conorhini]